MIKLIKEKTYKISCRRKGSFSIKVVSTTKSWVVAIIINGQTAAMNACNRKYEGEEVTLRREFITSAVETIE